ncbi:MAG TPA: hypothetical protein VGJ30_04120 [Candidatus Angelobacter sp.]
MIGADIPDTPPKIFLSTLEWIFVDPMEAAIDQRKFIAIQKALTSFAQFPGIYWCV